jgi:hypothetical protein
MGKNVTLGYDARVIWGAANDGSVISTSTPVVGYLDMGMRDHFSIQSCTPFSGSTLAGTVTVRCSNDYVPPGGGYGQIPYAGAWSAMPTPLTQTIASGPNTILTYYGTISVRWLQFTFVQSSGSGVLSVWCNAKSLGG